MKIFGFANYVNKGLGGLDTKLKWSWKPAYWSLIKNPKPLLTFKSPCEVFGRTEKGFTLLLSRKNPAVGHIISTLKKEKQPFVYINWDEFVEEGVVYFDQSEKQYQLRYKKHVIDLTKARSIYFDYFELKEVFHYSRSKFTNKEKVFLARWLDVLKTLELVCAKAKWFPAKPSLMNFEAQDKFGELLLAEKMGLKIPQMIYSNDPREIQKFLKEKKAILKESGLKSFSDKQNNQLIFDSKIVSARDKKIAHIQATPCMFQEFIDKQYDLRVVVVEGKALAAKIDSQSDDNAKRDWRGREHLVPFTPYKLPQDLQKKLIRFVSHMGFRLANVDLVRGEDGTYYFLEMNRPGQWFFVESLSGIPVTKTLAKAFRSKA